LAGVCWTNPAGASMGATVTGCSSLIAGIAGAGNRPRASLVTADSMDDEVVDMVIPANTATSAALATRAISVPRIPTTSPAPRPAHRRAPGAYPDCGAGAERSSLSCASPVTGMIGWSVRAAAGGCELVTPIGYCRYPADYGTHTHIVQSVRAVTPVGPTLRARVGRRGRHATSEGFKAGDSGPGGVLAPGGAV
jgi:hypothetical protein